MSSGLKTLISISTVVLLVLIMAYHMLEIQVNFYFHFHYNDQKERERCLMFHRVIKLYVGFMNFHLYHEIIFILYVYP